MIYRALLLVGDSIIVEAMLSDRFYEQAMGALEYLPEAKGSLKCRDFFKKSNFKQVVEIKNP